MNNKALRGQFFTTNADRILEGFEHTVRGKDVIDPFCGSGDLINWALKNGSSTNFLGYDIEPKPEVKTIKQDTLADPPGYKDKFVLTNPPYLLRGKTKDKRTFDRWKTDDLFRCFLKSLMYHRRTLTVKSADLMPKEGLVIVPINFLSSDNRALRNDFFKYFMITKMKLFEQQVFDDTPSTVCAFHFVKRAQESDTTRFKLKVISDDYRKSVHYDCVLNHKNGWKYGTEFYDYLDDVNGNIKFRRLMDTERGGPPPDSRLHLVAMDGGTEKSKIKLVYVEDDADIHYSIISDRAKAHIVLDDRLLSESTQRMIVEMFNELLEHYREKYQSLFLPNYRQSSAHYARKRMPFTMAYALINAIIEEIHG